MSTRADSVTTFTSEFEKADLGDERLNRRLIKVVDATVRAPSSSFPKQARNASELEAIYRFLGNDNIEWTDILASHVEATIERSFALESALVLHDSTEFAFGGESEREGLGDLTQNRQGFIGHFSLCVANNKSRTPLGVVGIEPLFREKQPKRTRSQKVKEVRLKDRADRESSRWERAAIPSCLGR